MNNETVHVNRQAGSNTNSIPPPVARIARRGKSPVPIPTDHNIPFWYT
jgi:hypothetical protein